MTNLSQQKREEMLAYLDKLRDLHGDDESLRLINQIQSEINNKRYGLIWEEHSEHVDEMLVDNIPVFVDVPERTIVSDKSKKFNFLLEGDNLHSLKLLRKTHTGKIGVIYIDPPYNTGSKDFCYDDAFVDSTDTYVHSKWLSFMSKRLEIAKELLTNDGVIFISIDDNELSQLKLLCDSIFGEKNFRNKLIVRRRVKSLNSQFSDAGLSSYNVGCEFVLVYSKTDQFKFRTLYMKKQNNKKGTDKDGNLIGTWQGFWNNADRPTMRYELLGFTPREGQWRWQKELAFEAAQNYQEYLDNFANSMSLEEYWEQTGKCKTFIRRDPKGKGQNGGVYYWLPPTDLTMRTSNWTDIEVSQIHKEFKVPFNNPKNVDLIATIVDSVPSKDCIVLDFFAGSGTTGHAVQKLNAADGGNRTYILCTNNENGICENVTHERVLFVQEKHPHNFRYYRTDFVAKFNPDDEDHSVTDATLENIRELIELEHQTYIDGVNNALLLDNDDIQYVLMNVADGANVYASSWIFFGAEDFQLIEEKGLNVITIPNYYFEGELIEVGEC